MPGRGRSPNVERMRRRVGLVVLFLALALAATVVSPAGARPSGAWTTHRSTGNGFRISAPSTWIDATRLTPQVIARMKKVPQLAGYLAAIQRSHAIKLILVDAGPLTIANHYSITCNVAQVPTIGDLQLARDATVAELKGTGLVRGAVHAGYVTLPAGKAVELRYQERVGSTTPTVMLDQFIFVRKGTATAISYATLPKLASTERAVFLRSVRSFRFSA